MSRIKLDLNSFKHVKSDKHSTILQHKDGHQLTLAHNALSPESREQLHALRTHKEKEGISEQGKDVRHAHKEQARDEARGRAAEERFVRPNMKGLAEGGNVPKSGKEEPKSDKKDKPHGDTLNYKQLKAEKRRMDIDETARTPHNLRRRYEEGGRVAVPQGQSEQRPQEKKEHPVPANVNTPASLDEAWKRVKTEFGLAEGGNIDKEHMNSVHKKQLELAEKHYSNHSPSEKQKHRNKIEDQFMRNTAGGSMKTQYAEGGTASNEMHPYDKEYAYDNNLPCLNPDCKSHGSPHPNCRCYQRLAEGGSIRHRYCAYGKPHMEDCEYYSGGRVQYAEGTEEVEPAYFGPGPVPAPIYEEDDKDVNQEVNDNENYQRELASAEAQQPQSNMAPEADPNFNSVTGKTEQPRPSLMQPQPSPAQQQQAPAPQLAPPPEESKLRHESIAIPQVGQSPQDHAQEVYQQMNKEAALVAKDYADGHISPKTYNDLMYHNKDGSEKSTVGKLSSIFGLLLSGAGSGLAHQQNMVLEMMNKTIDNDLEGQKKTKESQLNFLNHAKEYLRTKSETALQGEQGKLLSQQTEAAKINNDILAQTRAKNAMMLGFVKELYGMTDNLPPEQQARVRQATDGVSGVVQQKIMQDNAKAAQAVSNNSAMAKGSEQEYNATTQKLRAAGMLGMEGATDQAGYRESHMIPGVGTTTKPADSAAQDRVMKINNFQNLLNEAKNLAHAQKFGPLSLAQKARATAIESDLVSSYNDVKGLNRFTSNEEALYKDVVPHLSSNLSALTGTRKESLDRLIDSVQQKKDLEYKQLGVKPFTKEQQAPQFQEGQTGKFKGKPVVYRNGKWVPQ